MVFNLMFWLGDEWSTQYTNKYFQEKEGIMANIDINWDIIPQVINGVISDSNLNGVVIQEIDGQLMTNDLINNKICNG